MGKTSKSFRFSEEVCKILDEQPNATQYLEDLVLGKADQRVPWGNLEFKIDKLQETVDQIGVVAGTPRSSEPAGSQRTKTEIRQEITDLENEAQERLEYLQDPKEAEQLSKEYQQEIDKLWEEYHSS